MTVAGIGCRKGAASDNILAAIDAALAQCALSRADLDALATVPQKREEAGLREASEQLGLPLLIPDADALAAAETHTSSQASRDATGLASASEAAALAACGAGARLVRPRIVTGDVTCAIAVAGDLS